jgi:ABC-2 type transport system permease protein
MNYAMVRRLIYKDWYFNRWAIAAYVTAGLLALVPIAIGGNAGFFAGSVLLITVLITIGIHLTMVTVVNERQYQTLVFVMTLPISIHEYTTAKIVANVAIFGAAWTTLLVWTVAVIAGRGNLPDGLIPFAVAILAQIFAGYCLVLCTALVSESLGWTIGAMVLTNLLTQGVMYWISNVPAVATDLKGDAIVWRPQIVGLLWAELAAILLMLALTFYLQTRKTDFL